MFKHDSTGIDPDKFDLMPEGWYAFRIFEADESRSANGRNMVLAKCEVMNDTKFAGRTIWHFVTFIEKGSPGEGISVHFRKCIGVPYGGIDDVDAKDWIGKKLMGKVVHESWQGKLREKIKAVSPYEGPTPLLAPKPQEVDEEVPF